jgi:hypothetical protein
VTPVTEHGEPGTASRTALVLPVPEAAGVVADAHVALVDPFLPVEQLDDGVLAELREFFADLVPFPFVLGEQARFPTGSAYLPPQPVEIFRRVIHELRRAFPEVVTTTTTLDTFVPHLAIPDDSVVVRPIEGLARETQLRVLTGGTTTVRATFRFGTSAA